MGLTKVQKSILDNCCKEFASDSLICDDGYDYTLNCYLLVALESVNDYEKLEEDAINYVRVMTGLDRWYDPGKFDGCDSDY